MNAHVQIAKWSSYKSWKFLIETQPQKIEKQNLEFWTEQRNNDTFKNSRNVCKKNNKRETNGNNFRRKSIKKYTLNFWCAKCLCQLKKKECEKKSHKSQSSSLLLMLLMCKIFWTVCYFLILFILLIHHQRSTRKIYNHHRLIVTEKTEKK